MNLYENLKVLESALVPIFRNLSHRQRYIFIQDKTQEISEIISNVITKDALFLHHNRREFYYEAIKQLHHMFAISRYCYNNDVEQDQQLIETFNILKSVLRTAASGSVYLFRHCHPENTKSVLTKSVHKGIANWAVKHQALKRADEIVDELRLYPSTVAVFLFTSELERTNVFAQLIQDKIRLANLPNVYLHNIEHHDGIKADYFSPEAETELAPHMDTPLATLFEQWYYRKGDFANMQHQPDPIEISQGVEHFIRSKFLRHNVVIGISHSFIIDSFIRTYFTDLQINDIIGESNFIKFEQDQVCYLGEWK